MSGSSARSAAAQGWQRLYNTARWRRLRESVLTASPLCVYCLAQENVEPATVVDHIKAHKGDPSLFWDTDNLQPLCAACHNGRKQREDLGLKPKGCDAGGWPL